MNRDGSLLNRTEAALISRGFDTAKAAELRKGGWTLSALQQETDENLEKLGVQPHVIASLRAVGRPTIPFESLLKVLVAGRFTCCVCRKPELPIIVHHIQEWAESHDHSPENLALLCLHHHDRAHSTSTLSQNLTSDKIQGFKNAWEVEVRTLDATAILTASRIQSDAWLYFNHLRLFELARSTGINFRKTEHFAAARASELIDDTGTLRERDRAFSYMYDSGDGLLLYAYVRAVFHQVLERLTVLNVSDTLDRGVLSVIAQPGDFVLAQGAFKFSNNGQRAGRNQITVGARRANHVEIEFTFDRWEATSSSAWGRWLRGRQDVAAIVRLTNVVNPDGTLKLAGTVFAIAQPFTGMKSREYSTFPYRQGVFAVDEEDDEKVWQL
jgi:hypothetical protein